MCRLITHSAVYDTEVRAALNESKTKQARYNVSAKDPPTFIGGQPVRFKLDEKRRLRSGDLR
jgi:hypothetical protein